MSRGVVIPAILATQVATQLGFGVQPSAAAAAATITPSVTVLVKDGSGVLVPSSTASITVALTTAGGATLSGTLTRAAVAGTATFNDLSVNNAGTYTLTATATGLTSAVSTSFTIT